MNLPILLAFFGGLFFLLAIHPFVTYPLSLLAIRAVRGRRFRRRRESGPVTQPRIAFLFCAYNEEAVIEEKAKNLIEICSSLPGSSIHVYTDGCSDRTVEKLAPYRDRIRVIEGQGRQGKSAGMKQLMRGVEADLLVFTDANVIISPASASLIAGYFDDPRVGCVCGQLTYTNPGESTTAATGSAYWKFEEWLKRLESDVESTIAADGALFIVRRELWNEVPPDIIDDAFTSTSVFCRGLDVVQAKDICATERGAVSSTEEFRRKIRISCRTFNCTTHLWPKLRAMSGLRQYFYFSHKLLRWFTIFSLAFAALFFGFALALLSIPTLLIVVAGSLVALGLGYAGVRLFSAGYEALASFTAAGIGVIHSLRGRRHVTWTPAGSTR